MLDYFHTTPTVCPHFITDPASVLTEEAQETAEPQETTAEPQEDVFTVPEPDTSSDPQMSTVEQTQGSSTGESVQEPASIPVGDTSSDPASNTRLLVQEQHVAQELPLSISGLDISG
ncbi:protein FAM160A1-like [Amblyraja radiata]|uniref:protein FAM160A1-like n=1 Tax=Amblyraja radiata TaxID=386614 RepID=UPI001402161F|nr:protein FAM160A1-like [Amblyraja radiata]